MKRTLKYHRVIWMFTGVSSEIWSYIGLAEFISSCSKERDGWELYKIFHSEKMINCLWNKTLKNKFPFSQISQLLKKESHILKLYKANNINEIGLGNWFKIKKKGYMFNWNRKLITIDKPSFDASDRHCQVNAELLKK